MGRLNGGTVGTATVFCGESMLLVDNRDGSCELVEPLTARGLPVRSLRMPYGDLAWVGRGLKGCQVSIGVEFKKLGELVQSLRTERLQGHQMVGMRDEFDYCYLLVEGELMYDRQGTLTARGPRINGRPGFVNNMPGQMTIAELLMRLNVLHLCGGLTPILSPSREDTLQLISALYRTWTDKDLDQHRSHIAMYNAPPLVPISQQRMTLKTLPRIGMRASKAVADHFGNNLGRAFAASVEEWAGIEVIGDNGKPRKLGKAAAREIVAFIKGAPA